MNIEDQTCPICMELFFSPVKTTCGHIFCRHCAQNVNKISNKTCPLCRSVMQYVSDSNLKQRLVATFPQEYAQRKLEVSKEKHDAYFSNKVNIKLLIGNWHKKISRSRSSWVCFVRTEDKNVKEEDYIESVTFKSDIDTHVLCDAPFELTGFNLQHGSIVQICIVFKQKCATPPLQTLWSMCFESDGLMMRQVVTVTSVHQEDNTIMIINDS